MKNQIYLDNNSSTKIDPEFINHLSEFLKLDGMNASSIHTNGQLAKKIILQSKQSISKLLHINPREITFTSGGTESMNHLIFGILKAQKFDAIYTTKLEHACVYESCIELKKQGYPIVFLPSDNSGVLKITELEKIKPKNSKLCIITSAVNSETGALLNIKELADYCLINQITLILDGVALLGKTSLFIHEGITGIGFSSHKIHAPKGCGFYYLKDSTPFSKLSFGGTQESSRRAGTENLFGIYGTMLAIDKLIIEQDKIETYLKTLTLTFLKELTNNNCEFYLNITGPTISNTLNLYFPNIDGESFLMLLDQNGIMASVGSACSSGALEPSRVLLEMLYSKNRAKQSLRFSFSRLNTLEEVISAAKLISELAYKLKTLS